jgi:RHS repeat-associated protein
MNVGGKSQRQDKRNFFFALTNRIQNEQLYTFVCNGKEKDYESGFHYYGARYYWGELLTGWLSVDPMADKYPSISPYAYCVWNPAKLIDPDGREAIDNDGWYKDEKGKLQWDPSVTKNTPLKNDEEYLGETVLLTNSNGQTIYGDEHGKLQDFVPLAEVNVTADAAPTETNVNVAVPVAVPIGAFVWNQLPTAAVATLEAAATIAWMIPACLLLSGDSSPNQDIRGGHDSNVRKSTKGKHESGDSRRMQDQQGSKGEKIMKGKRPQGYKGPWPPKKKKK